MNSYPFDYPPLYPFTYTLIDQLDALAFQCNEPTHADTLRTAARRLMTLQQQVETLQLQLQLHTPTGTQP